MKDEIEALNSNHTWDIFTLPKGKSSIGCMWIYKVKYKASGEKANLKLGWLKRDTIKKRTRLQITFLSYHENENS